MSVRGATTCPYSGTPVTAADAKKAGMRGELGEQLVAVVCIEPGRRGKVYLPAESSLPPGDIPARVVRLAAREGLDVPTEPLPAKDSRWFQPVIYGMDSYGKLHLPRQQLLLLTFCKLTRLAARNVAEESGDTEFAAAVAAYLGLLVGRVADRGSTLCHWDNTAEKTANTYARQALPMVWDFSEAGPFGGGSGDAGNQLGYILDCITHAVSTASHPAEVIHGRAQRLPVADESIDAIVTDPPYYDNISYADCSDFFYVWHKRALGEVFPQLYVNALTPKKAEAVVAVQRHEGKKQVAAELSYCQLLWIGPRASGGGLLGGGGGIG